MGLLDWLTDGSFGGGGLGDPSMGSGAPVNGGGTMPPVQQTGTDAPPLAPPTPPAAPPMPGPAPTTPDPTPAAGPPDPPVGAPPSQVPLPAPRPPGAPQPTFAPNQTNTNPISPPAPGFNASPLPPGGGVLSPDDAKAAVKSYQVAGGHAFDGYAPTAGAPTSLAPPAPGPGDTPYKLGDQTALGRALGIDPKSSAFNTALTGFGSGLTAAGNSKGKSPFQALTAGAGASIEGGAKEQHAANKDAQGYLTAAINAKKAGDDATYKTNYTAYLAAKLKSEQEAAASKDATANKNDSPTQLYLAAQRNVAADPAVKDAQKQADAARKAGNGPTDPNVIAAQANLQKTIQEREQAHLAGVGLHPQTAAQIAQQPGMSQANPINGKTAGITPENITKKLQPGQFYTNPSNGQLFVYKGEPEKSSTSKPSTPSSKPEPAEPMKKEKATTAAADEDDD